MRQRRDGGKSSRSSATSITVDDKLLESNSFTSNSHLKIHTNWNPPFLRIWLLVAFVLFWVLVIASLQILYSVSQRNRGVSTTDDGKYYLWTYGPTALFVVITVAWRQVDYAVKSIQPWAELASGPKSAEETLLLDYVTDYHLVAAWKAIRRKHFAVFSSCIIFFLVKGITIVSTAIFSLVAVREDGTTSIMLLDSTFGNNGNSYQVESVDSRSTYIVYGHEAYNVTNPPGTYDKYAVQTFSPQGGERNGSLSYIADVDVFSADLECESGSITYNISFSSKNGNAPTASFYNTSVALSDCQIHGAVLDAPDFLFVSGQPIRTGYYSTFQNVTCSNLPPDDPRSSRYMIAATYSEGTGPNENKLLNSSNVVCVPTYQIHKATVTLDTEKNVQDIKLSNEPPRKIEGVSALDIARGVAISAQQSYYLSTFSNADQNFDAFMSVLIQGVPQFQAADLLSNDFLEIHGRQTYQKLAAQLANLYLLSPPAQSDTKIEGKAVLTTNRLLVVQTPIRWMQGIAGVILLLTLVVIMTRPRNVIPRSVDSITAIAAILARSPDLERQLRQSGHLSLNDLRGSLRGQLFQTAISDIRGNKTFSIQQAGEAEKESRESTNNFANSGPSGIKWDRPLVLHRIAIATTIIISVVALIAVEILLSKSNKNHGIADVSNDTVSRYSWLYVPILVFVLLGTLFNIMDFQIEFSESYHALSKGFCDAPSSMLWYPLRNSSLHTSWAGLKHGRFALTASSISAVLAPFLTIVVAGLFHTKEFAQVQQVDVTPLNFFNLSGTYSGNNPIPALIIEGNMSYPQWTYDELTFPQLQPHLSDAGADLSTGLLSVDVPAIRGQVKCSVFPQDQVIQADIQYQGYLSFNISTPDECGNSGLIASPNSFLTNDAKIPVNASGYFGTTLPTGFNPGCPTIAIFYGHVTDNKVDKYVALSCKQGLERLNVNTTFVTPNLTISQQYPPQPYENSTTYFSAHYEGFPQLQSLNLTNSSSTNGPEASKNSFDDIFTAMVYGRDGVPPSQLLVLDNTGQPTNLIRSFTHTYRQYIAQVVNKNFRSNFSSFPEYPDLNATVSVPDVLHGTYTYTFNDNTSHLRLVQSALSTHILAGVLGVLLICAVTIFVTIDMRHVLPKPVGSIAAVASLLAGSRIVRSDSNDPGSPGSESMVPLGAEWWSDKEWESRGVWKEEMFRMGWWDQFGQPVDSWKGKFNGSDISLIGLNNGAPEVGDDPVQRGGSSSSNGKFFFRIDARPKIVA